MGERRHRTISLEAIPQKRPRRRRAEAGGARVLTNIHRGARSLAKEWPEPARDPWSRPVAAGDRWCRLQFPGPPYAAS